LSCSLNTNTHQKTLYVTHTSGLVMVFIIMGSYQHPKDNICWSQHAKHALCRMFQQGEQVSYLILFWRKLSHFPFMASDSSQIFSFDNE